MLKQAAVALSITVCIPVIGYLIAFAILNHINADIEDGMTAELICELQDLLGDLELQSACEEVRNIVLLREASMWAGVVAVGLVILYGVAALVAGKSRRLNAILFPKLSLVSSLVIAGLVLVEGAIIAYGAYIGESYLIGRVHFVLIGIVGLGALAGSYKLIASTFSLKKELSQSAVAMQVPASDQPRLWGLIEDLATDLDAKAPDNIIVGLEPTFYATAAKVQLINEKKALEGETLHLSLPLMRLFDRDELRAVIGHELGHFRGDDTVYSLKFAPVYAGLSRSIDALGDEEGGVSLLATLPAIAMFSLMIEIFSRNERRISRDRELEADKAGVGASNAVALATALAKVAVYAPLWSMVREQNVDRLNEGKVSANLSRIYQDSARYDVSHTSINALMDEILTTRISHPTDTHPTISERFENIGFDPELLSVERLVSVDESGTEVLENIVGFEEELTLFEHKLMVAFGRVSPPEGDEVRQTNVLLNAIYALAATMVGADGKIEQTEIAMAEAIGQKMFSNFDTVEFRDCCNNLAELPTFGEVVTILNEPLKEEHKLLIYDYLKEIAMADGELAEEEKKLLIHARSEWAIEV